MSYWRIFVLLALAQLANGVYLRDDEKPLRVRTVEEANGSKNYVFDFIGLAWRAGYLAEEHNVTTNDGYNIKIHRIPGSPLSPVSKGKPVVFLFHGMGGSSDYFILLQNRSFGFMLADAGYDVWFGNCRGNVYARSHQTLSPEEPRFWNFSLHEIGVMDIAAMIDYTLENTGESCLTYIGHSMGGTTVYILLSTLPEYNEKMKLVMTWGSPTSWKDHSLFRSIIRAGGPLIQKIVSPTGMEELVPQSNLIVKLVDVCKNLGIMDYCIMSVEFVAGENRAQLNESEIEEFARYYPAGMSMKTMWHYLQHIVNRKFRQYDYESDEENLQHYGQIKPPTYNMKKITAPIAIFYGSNDPTFTRYDAMGIARTIGNNAKVEHINQRFNHFDFVSAIDVKSILYNKILKTIDDYRHVDCALRS